MTKVTQEAERWAGNSKGLILLAILMPLARYLISVLVKAINTCLCLLVPQTKFNYSQIQGIVSNNKHVVGTHYITLRHQD